MIDELLKYFNEYKDCLGCLPDVLTILGITSAVYFIQKFIISALLRRSSVENNIYSNTIIHAISVPLSVIIWVIGFVSVAIAIREYFDDIIDFSWLETISRVATIITVGWVLNRIVARFLYNRVNPLDGKKPIDKTTALAIGRLSSIVIFIIVTLVIMQTLDIDVSGVVTIGSAGTLVVGFAAKDMLSNFFGGFMIFSDRPFKVGDWIRSPDKEIEGTVEHIGWRVTRIRTFDKRPLYVQNSIFLNISIENASRMTNRRIKETIGLRYSDASKIPSLTSSIENMLNDHPDIDSKQTTFVAFNHFGDSTLDCQVYCFTKTTNWIEYMKVQQDVFVKINDIVTGQGAEMAFPTCTVELPDKVLT